MLEIQDFKVELINKEEVKNFMKKFGRFAAICYDSNEKYAESIGKECLKSGHMSGSRGCFFEFKITGVPRDEIDQMVRHEQGVYKNVQSFRYVNKDGFEIYAPPEVLEDKELVDIFTKHQNESNENYNNAIKRLKELGYKGEQANQVARHMLPIGTESAYCIGLNIEAIIHMANVRLCNRAELPIRRITRMMINEIKEITNEYDELLVCKCDRDLYCTEGKCCGKRPTKDEFIKLISIK